MDHHDDPDVPGTLEEDDAPPLSDLERSILKRRSAAYRRDPSSAVPLDEALAQIERSLG